MKIKNIVTVFLVTFILASCGPTAKVVLTKTVLPTSTFTSIPPTSTITPTPAPENLADAKDLSKWVDNYVHAFGEKVMVNGVEMGTSQLSDEIRKNAEAFTKVKEIKGATYSFLVINDFPLTMREGNGQWKEATMGNLSDLSGITFDYSRRGFYLENTKLIDANNVIITMTTELDIQTVFGSFSQNDWTSVLNNWSIISQGFTDKKVPQGYPYNWSKGNDALSNGSSFLSNPGYRSQALLEPTMNLESLRKFKADTNATNEDMLKLLEFTVKSRVINFPQINEWDASDEIVDGFVNELPDFRFWELATSKKPSELAVLVGGWVKQVNPKAQTFITEGAIFDTSNANAKWSQDYFYNKFIKEVAALNNNENINGVISENNWWIFEPQNWEKIGKQIDILNGLGLKIGSSETMVVTGDIAINDDPANRPKQVKINNRDLAQAEMIRSWVRLYISKGIRQMGFGGLIDDKSAWTNDVGNPDANPLLLDDDLSPKAAYYSVLQVLYENLP